MSNPTNVVFEKRMALLEGGVQALATSSGQAAQLLAILNIAGTGDNFVSSSFLYGGTYNEFEVTFKKFGIGVNWVTEDDPAAFVKAIDEKTKAIYVETIANPGYTLSNIAALSKIAHDAGIPLIVDNTLGIGGYLIRPIEHGADIYTAQQNGLAGTAPPSQGVIIDGGKFDWAASGKFPGFTEPAEGYHGLVWSKTYGKNAYGMKLRHELMRDLGPSINPFGSFLLLQGLETLSLRAQRHSENALALARYLVQHPRVTWVRYLGLPSHESYELAVKTLRPEVFGGMLSFGFKGNMEETRRMVDHLRLASNLANVGDAKTLVIHPATTTHSQLTEEEQRETGVTPDLIRVSVGIEAIGDIIADFENALEVVAADIK
ncbi:hypothetical protein C0995_010877 [Termitomyces sp. Mi166|nr:hypothetical protein C0995_010877 [Termitomyces sp. Mi166\